MIVKYGDAEVINVIKPVDLTDEDTQRKLDDLKNESSKSQTDVDSKQE